VWHRAAFAWNVDQAIGPGLAIRKSDTAEKCGPHRPVLCIFQATTPHFGAPSYQSRGFIRLAPSHSIINEPSELLICKALAAARSFLPSQLPSICLTSALARVSGQLGQDATF
jgi:hypothetical protein